MSHIKEEVDKILKLGGWEKLFVGLRTRTTPYLDKFPAVNASNEHNLNKNRYRDVLPYDATRVKLDDSGAAGRVVDDYINASFVHIERAHRKYILTQGPLESTQGDFWHMIWEQKCPAIVMLNKYIEGSFPTPKCHTYVPDDPDDILIVDEEGTRVKLVSRTPMPSYILSKIEIDRQSVSGGEDGVPKTHKSLGKRTVTHYQYTEWPDFGVPECPDKFLDFLKAIRDSGALDNTEKEPIAVHCSAGIGRSGTFVMVDTSLVLISENVRVDVISLLEDLRQYRYGLVQTQEQLRFTYEAIIKGIEKFIGPLDEVSKRLVEPHPRLTPPGAPATPEPPSPAPNADKAAAARSGSAASSSGRKSAERAGSRQLQTPPQDRPMFRRQAGRMDSLAEQILREDGGRTSEQSTTKLEGTLVEDDETEQSPSSPMPVSPKPLAETADSRPQSKASTCNGGGETHGDEPLNAGGGVGVHDNDGTGRLSVAAMEISDRSESSQGRQQQQPARSNSKQQQRTTPSPRPPSNADVKMKCASPVDDAVIPATPNLEAVAKDADNKVGGGGADERRDRSVEFCDKSEQLLGGGGVSGVSGDRKSSASSAELRERRLERTAQLREKLDSMKKKQHEKAQENSYFTRKNLMIPVALVGLSLIFVGGLTLWRLATSSPN